MSSIEHDHTIAIFYQLVSMNVMHSTCVGHTFQAQGRHKVHRYHIVGITMLVVVQLLGQSVAVNFIIITQMVAGIQNLIHSRTD